MITIFNQFYCKLILDVWIVEVTKFYVIDIRFQYIIFDKHTWRRYEDLSATTEDASTIKKFFIRYLYTFKISQFYLWLDHN